MLNTYLTQTQNLLGVGASGALYSNTQLIAYINTARNQIAAEGQCVRALPAISGPISTITVVSAGVGFTSAPTITISAPDFPSGANPFPAGAQATAIAAVSGGRITAVTLLSAGQGYFAPAITATSGHGQGAVLVATISGINQTQTGQEIYPFSAVNNMVATSGSGIQSILAVNSISLIWASFRYTLQRVSFSKYQAKIRNYSVSYQDVPSIFSQFGQGASGSVYAYPVASQPYQWEWDCYCTVLPLATDTDVEALPYPWTDCVQFLAAYLAFQQASRSADADRMWREYEKFMKRARQMSNPRGVSSWYGG